MIRSIILTGSLLAAGFMTPFATQDEPSTQTSRNRFPSRATGMRETLPRSTNGFSSFFGSSSKQRELDQDIADTAKELRQAKSETAREQAEQKLRTLLSKDYDSRLEGYEEELKEMEQKIAEMRKRLAKRRNAKEDMIKLRVKVLEAEAEDLGWPARRRSSSLTGLRSSSGSARWATPSKSDLKPSGKASEK